MLGDVAVNAVQDRRKSGTASRSCRKLEQLQSKARELDRTVLPMQTGGKKKLELAYRAVVRLWCCCDAVLWWGCLLAYFDPTPAPATNYIPPLSPLARHFPTERLPEPLTRIHTIYVLRMLKCSQSVIVIPIHLTEALAQRSQS